MQSFLSYKQLLQVTTSAITHLAIDLELQKEHKYGGHKKQSTNYVFVFPDKYTCLWVSNHFMIIESNLYSKYMIYVSLFSDL